MRADRLVAALLLMQARGRVTAAELAEELEVSVATARRDLEALSTAGIPVYPQAGRGGGWSLLGGARTDLSGLTAHEAQALFLLAGPAAPAAPEVRSALRKLLRALPQTFRADAEAAAGAVVVDPTRWGEPEKERPAVVRVLQDAVVRRRKVRLAYEGRSGGGPRAGSGGASERRSGGGGASERRSGSGAGSESGGGAASQRRERSERLVEPWGLVAKDDVWYLLAGTERGRRTFRVDRIAGAEVTELEFERPDDFALAREWEEVVAEMERRRSTVSATVLISARFLPVLRHHFGRHSEVAGDEPDGRVRVRVAAPMPLTIAEQLAGWGARVEVVEPEEVRAELARIGAELVERNRPRDGSGG
ncbi:WYL domain-containing protein [Nonomuraea maheshkhaliensis]|uniref:WYL domain-containing protein n=1 Tax=Nonomuraea maheshkhaliensis TaxID=419590 RepID=A0ABN2EZS5_9ACTN